MKLVVSVLSVVVMLSTVAEAFPGGGRGGGRPGWGDGGGRPGWGHGPGRPRPPMPPPAPRPPMGSEACGGFVEGYWGNHNTPIRISVGRSNGREVAISIQHQRGGEDSYGTCNESFDGTATLMVNGRTINGSLTYYRNGQVSGNLSGFAFNGQRSGGGGGGYPPPHNPYPPQPPVRDLCQGLIQGVWMFRGQGHTMDVTLSRTGGESVSVTIQSQGRVDTMTGVCRYAGPGVVTVTFEGVNGGALTVREDTRVDGTVSGYPYTGTKR